MNYSITIDARMIRHTGIGTYTQNMISAIAGNYNLTLLGNYDTLTSFSWSNQVKIIPTTSSIYSLSEQTELQKKIQFCDLFISPHYNIPLQKIKASKRVVVIHDVNHLTNINKISLIKRLYAKYMINAAIKKSDKVITVSEFSRSEINKYTISKKDIGIIYCGMDINEIRNKINNESLARIKLKYNLPGNYILYVGNMKPHKNIDVVIKAMKFLSEFQDKKLVVVGAQLDEILQKLKMLDIPGLEKNIYPIQYVGNEVLPLLYNNAECLIFPSLYEGFGIPPIEAMICGCPVLASNAASIPEVCGDAALFFNPNDANELADKIMSVLKNKDLRSELLWKGDKNAQRFSIENFREKLIYIINETITN